MVGVNLNIQYLSLGSICNSLDFISNKGAIFCRAAGTGVQILKKMYNYIIVRLPSKEERILNGLVLCNIGIISNELHRFKNLLKAGNNINIGRRPVVRGVAKNSVDHPHGGGEGRTSGGQPSVTPWGIYTKGIKTTTKQQRRGGILLVLRKKKRKKRK